MAGIMRPLPPASQVATFIHRPAEEQMSCHHIPKCCHFEGCCEVAPGRNFDTPPYVEDYVSIVLAVTLSVLN